MGLPLLLPLSLIGWISTTPRITPEGELIRQTVVWLTAPASTPFSDAPSPQERGAGPPTSATLVVGTTSWQATSRMGVREVQLTPITGALLRPLIAAVPPDTWIEAPPATGFFAGEGTQSLVPFATYTTVTLIRSNALASAGPYL